MKIEDISQVSLAALKLVSLSGPVAVAMTGTGSAVLAISLYGGIQDDHTQGALIVCASVLIVLGFVEWAIARRFSSHEQVERDDRKALIEEVLSEHRRDMAYMANLVGATNTGYETIDVTTKKILVSVDASTVSMRELTAKVDGIRADVDDLKTWRTRISDRLGTLR